MLKSTKKVHHRLNEDDRYIIINNTVAKLELPEFEKLVSKVRIVSKDSKVKIDSKAYEMEVEGHIKRG